MRSIDHEPDCRVVRELAGNLFGNNKGERKSAMAAPVTQAAVPRKLEMKAASALEPLDARVRIREVPTWPGQENLSIRATTRRSRRSSCGATRSGCSWPDSPEAPGGPARELTLADRPGSSGPTTGSNP